MSEVGMSLKVLLPFRVFIDVENVKSIIAETREGSFGLLMHRLDGVAALEPGILTYETAAGVKKYLAVDEGILVKAGPEVQVSVRNAVGGAELEELEAVVKKEFLSISEEERILRSTLVKLEVDIVRRFAALKENG